MIPKTECYKVKKKYFINDFDCNCMSNRTVPHNEKIKADNISVTVKCLNGKNRMSKCMGPIHFEPPGMATFCVLQ
jgi:hypothetical protein